MEQGYKVLLNTSKSEDSFRTLYCDDGFLRYEDKITDNIIETKKMTKEDLEELNKINNEISSKFEETYERQNEFSSIKKGGKIYK